QDFAAEWVSASIHNPGFPTAGGDRIPLTVSLTWSTKQLAKLVQWKMPGAGVHVLGIEPANCYVEGRATERASGDLQFLKPGEVRHYDLALEVLLPGAVNESESNADES
ncbi:MAG: DUF4432 family protein, partial [Chloroflexota bacterium]